MCVCACVGCLCGTELRIRSQLHTTGLAKERSVSERVMTTETGEQVRGGGGSHHTGAKILPKRIQKVDIWGPWGGVSDLPPPDEALYQPLMRDPEEQPGFSGHV